MLSPIAPPLAPFAPPPSPTETTESHILWIAIFAPFAAAVVFGAVTARMTSCHRGRKPNRRLAAAINAANDERRLEIERTGGAADDAAADRIVLGIVLFNAGLMRTPGARRPPPLPSPPLGTTAAPRSAKAVRSAPRQGGSKGRLEIRTDRSPSATRRQRGVQTFSLDEPPPEPTAGSMQAGTAAAAAGPLPPTRSISSGDTVQLHDLDGYANGSTAVVTGLSSSLVWVRDNKGVITKVPPANITVVSTFSIPRV